MISLEREEAGSRLRARRLVGAAGIVTAVAAMLLIRWITSDAPQWLIAIAGAAIGLSCGFSCDYLMKRRSRELN